MLDPEQLISPVGQGNSPAQLRLGPPTSPPSPTIAHSLIIHSLIAHSLTPFTVSTPPASPHKIKPDLSQFGWSNSYEAMIEIRA
ncbi:hypothetical protein ACN4EG_18320 [Alkalinema pantanalense CENA528]|uniref:hypothetical protein n=1 Tax=Alkalinema pantanalense TaxID=1620705 RepID=UPI003D6F3CF3